MATKDLKDSVLIEKFNIVSKAECFFVQRIKELLFYKTFNSYQYKLHNSKSLLYEIREVIPLVLRGDLNPSNLSTLINELKDSIKNDPVYNAHFSKIKQDIFEFNKKHFSEGKNENILHLKYRVDFVIDRLEEEGYTNFIINDLKKAINENNYDIISKLTTQLVSEFLNNGVRTRSITAKFHEIFDKNDLSFERRYDLFSDFLLKKEYRITSKGKLFIEISNYNKSQWNFTENIYNNKDILQLVGGSKNANVKKGIYLERDFEVFKDNIYLSISDEMEKIERETSLHAFNRDTVRLNKENIIFLLEEPSSKRYKLISVNNFYTSNGNKERSFLHKEYSTILEELEDLGRNHQNDRDRIFSSLRNYSIGSRPNSQETTLLMLWSSLESLLKLGHYNNNIEHIIKIVPKLLSNNYKNNLVKNFVEELERLSIKTLECDGNSLEIEDDIGEILKDKEMKKLLKVKLEDYSLLYHRVEELSKVVNDISYSISLVKKHRERIEWHIYRIYRLRNNLIHSAKTNQQIDHLNGHLDFYVRETLSYIINEIDTVKRIGLGGTFENIENKFDYEIMQNKK
ncbi:hypothetical protein [Salinicoccus halitifaciens]|uniref:Apea-like HEPN domain-containing protein n=1 Tax=Salinicoccus halitifaciens TaxID=1073415 RepID=A0ABV2ECD0_9STAP|nr:hypothetical protein [Salinicoccus halitifaciens]MCD2138747.1 hypothetical protein [Salinicoccus halitifaciens]